MNSKNSNILNDVMHFIKGIPQNAPEDLNNTLLNLLVIAYNTSFSIYALGQGFNLINHTLVHQFRKKLQSKLDIKRPASSNGLKEQTVNNYNIVCASVQNPDVPLYQPKTIVAFKNIKALLKTKNQQDNILKQLNDIANLSPQEHGDYINSFMQSKRITAQNCKREKLPPILIGQNGVYAQRNIPAFTVLGYYGGIYFTNPEELMTYATGNGVAYKTYMFSFPDTEFPRLSAYLHGNDLSLVNAGTIYSGTAHTIAREIVEKCNLSVVYAKSLEYPDSDYVNNPEKYDLVTYVTNRAIKKGEQLFINYGMNYWKNRNDNFTTATSDEIFDMVAHFRDKNNKTFKQVYKKK